MHICQRWQSLVFVSPPQLELYLTCSYGIHVRKNLVSWPVSLPLAIDYSFFCHVPTLLDEDNITAALEYPSHVHSIKIDSARAPLMKKVVTIMQKSFPSLIHLDFRCHYYQDSFPVIPRKFLCGSVLHLQHLCLEYISSPHLPILLSSAHNLITLTLYHIPLIGYILEGMARLLAMLTSLTTFSISCSIETSPSDHWQSWPDFPNMSHPSHYHPLYLCRSLQVLGRLLGSNWYALSQPHQYWIPCVTNSSFTTFPIHQMHTKLQDQPACAHGSNLLWRGSHFHTQLSRREIQSRQSPSANIQRSTFRDTSLGHGPYSLTTCPYILQCGCSLCPQILHTVVIEQDGYHQMATTVPPISHSWSDVFIWQSGSVYCWCTQKYCWGDGHQGVASTLPDKVDQGQMWQWGFGSRSRLLEWLQGIGRAVPLLTSVLWLPCHYPQFGRWVCWGWVEPIGECCVSSFWHTWS